MSSETTASNNPWFKNSTPWGRPEPCIRAPCSFEDVMSEQLAQELENKETNKNPSHQSHTGSTLNSSSAIGGASYLREDELLAAKLAEEEEEVLGASSAVNLESDAELAAKLAAEEGGDLSNDELIALCLQREFDKEHNSTVDMIEKTYNGTSKVSISFENYKRRSPLGNDNLDEEDSDDEEFPELSSQTSWEKSKPVMGVKGYSRQGKDIITKHDKTICGRRNAERLMEFPPEFESGDGEGMDMQLPNKVYNHLKVHSQSENKKSHKVHEKKDHSTAIKALDEKTRIMMFKLVNSGYLASIEGVINEGKEAVVFKANGGMKDDEEIPKDVILKVFKTTMNEFKTRARYIYGDHRLSKDVLKKQNPRKIMRLWAEKEYLNLKKIRRHNLPCPQALILKKHVLVMTCIGGENPAPKLKDVKLSAEHMQDAYEQTIDLMKAFYRKCGLVHADLSEYNLLWHDDRIWVIDVSQARQKDNANSQVFLYRDCQNICDFFRLAGVYNVISAEELFMQITDYSFEGQGKVFEAQTERYSKDEYAFDFYFELANAVESQPLHNEESSESEEGDVEDSLPGKCDEENKQGHCSKNRSGEVLPNQQQTSPH